jgi:hypothetical protein
LLPGHGAKRAIGKLPHVHWQYGRWIEVTGAQSGIFVEHLLILRRQLGTIVDICARGGARRQSSKVPGSLTLLSHLAKASGGLSRVNTPQPGHLSLLVATFPATASFLRQLTVTVLVSLKGVKGSLIQLQQLRTGPG